MSEYNKEDIKNLHYNNVNEIQYEYGGQIYHCRMKHLKEILVTCWNLQQENKKQKEVIDKAIEYINHFSKESEVKIYGLPKCKVFIGDIEQLLEILKEVE